MSRRRRQGISPSLFPFLAVLICTLGTLILLLALVAQDAKSAAEQNARAAQRRQENMVPTAATATRISRESAEELLQDEQFRVQELTSVRDQQTADVERRRDEVTHLDDHIARLRQQLRRLNEEVQQATGATEAPRISAAAVSAIQDQIEAERLKVEKLRDESSDLSPRVVIVPHKGPNGTDRRPVYIECDDKGVTIWPEGSKIPVSQLENSSYSANPLDAALRTIRMHAMQTYGDSVPPYPLLVVRPDGIETYGAARRAMKEWDDQFGYELVPGEVKLAFAKPDSNLKRRIDVAINTAAAAQRVRTAMSPRSGGNGRSRSGEIRGSSRSRRASLPTLSAAALDQSGRANGFRQLRDEYSRPSSASSITGSPYTQGPQIGSVNRNGHAGSASEIGDAGAAARRLAAQMETAAAEMRSAKQGLKTNSRGTAASNPSPGLSSPLGKHFADLPPWDEPSRDQQGSLDRDSNDARLDARVGQQERREADRNRHPFDTGVPGNASTDDSPSNQDAPSQPDLPNGSKDGSSSKHSTSSQRSSSNYSSNDPRASLNPRRISAQRSAGQKTSSNQAMPQQIPQNMRPQMRPAADLVQRRGRDWALPPSMEGMHGNEIIRTIRVQCYHDRFVLLPPKNEGATEVFVFFNGDIDRATLELATALRDRVKLWGPALPGGRWRPRLEVQIRPRGDMRFHQLRTLMNDSGFEIVGRESP